MEMSREEDSNSEGTRNSSVAIQNQDTTDLNHATDLEVVETSQLEEEDSKDLTVNPDSTGAEVSSREINQLKEESHHLNKK